MELFASGGPSATGARSVLSCGLKTKAGQSKLPAQKEAQERETGRIVRFVPRLSRAKETARTEAESEIQDLRKYEQSTEPDDYPRRMLVNGIAFAFIVMLTLVGIWLADTMALLRKNQDCVISGRRNCTPIDVHATERQPVRP